MGVGGDAQGPPLRPSPRRMSPLGAARGRARPHLPSHWPAVPPPLLKDLPQPLRGTEFSGKHCFCDRNQDGSDEAVLGNGAGGHRGAYPVLDVGHRGRSEAEAPAGSPRDFIRDRKTQDTAQTSFCPEPCWPHSHSEPPPPQPALCGLSGPPVYTAGGQSPLALSPHGPTTASPSHGPVSRLAPGGLGTALSLQAGGDTGPEEARPLGPEPPVLWRTLSMSHHLHGTEMRD